MDTFLDHCAREMTRLNGMFSHGVISPELSLRQQPWYQISLQKPNISALENFSSDLLWGIAIYRNSETSPHLTPFFILVSFLFLEYF